MPSHTVQCKKEEEPSASNKQAGNTARLQANAMSPRRFSCLGTRLETMSGNCRAAGDYGRRSVPPMPERRIPRGSPTPRNIHVNGECKSNFLVLDSYQCALGHTDLPYLRRSVHVFSTTGSADVVPFDHHSSTA